MDRRIQNTGDLLSHGNVRAREAILEIVGAGLKASDPYYNTRKLIRLEGDKLIVGGKEFEPSGSPVTGEEEYKLSEVGRIYVFGAGKGMQRVAKAIEDVLGDRLDGGHVIDKKGHEVILEKIGVTLGAHPVPDEDCVKGCERIREMADNLSEGDLVFTCAGNGVSSLLTMPVPGVSLEDVSKMTYIMQVERGVPTGDLNPIRNYLDMMKGGKISRLIQPAQAIHIIAVGPGSYDRLMNHNLWLHTLPDCTTYQLAIDNLKKWGAWEAVPSSIREYLEAADPSEETVKAEEFEKMRFRIFGVMPGIGQAVEVPVAMERARELGFKPVILAESLSSIEASQAGRYMAAITRTIEHNGQPFEPPCALFSSGEMIVTVGKEKGIGGRNQEFALSAALGIAGSKNIVIASVDTDGTDGPGIQFSKGPEGMPSCFAGGIVDGETVGEMEEAGVDIVAELKKHNTSLPLWKTGNGIVATPDISINDLTVALVTGYNK